MQHRKSQGLMKRDLNLVREILLKLEPLPAHFDEPVTLTVGQGPLAIDGRSPDEIGYHLRVMAQGDLIRRGEINKGTMSFPYYGLTWEGHEILDDVRDPEIWRKTKERAKAVGSVGLGFLWEIAKLEVRTKLGL